MTKPGYQPTKIPAGKRTPPSGGSAIQPPKLLQKEAEDRIRKEQREVALRKYYPGCDQYSIEDLQILEGLGLGERMTLDQLRTLARRKK